MEYREFLSLTNDEIKFILNDIFKPKKIGKIKRDKKLNEIIVNMTTEWGSEDDEDGIIEMTDEVILTLNDIDGSFKILSEDIIKWKKFLIAKGCNELLKNNPFL